MISDQSVPDRIASFCPSLFPPGASILVAVSGGGDSTALLVILHRLKERLGINRLGVLHVNHGLRGAESDADEAFVAGLAKRLGAPLFHKKLSGRSLHDRGIEEWARGERYSFFLKVKERERYDRIATGHTADDQAETVFFRIMRGTGLRGLRGILPLRDDGVVRPLLGLWRKELHGWLQQEKISFRHDSSNDECIYERNRIRHQLLPFINRRERGAPEKLALVAEKTQKFWELLGPGIDRWIAKNVSEAAGGFNVLKEGLADGLHASEGLRLVFEKFGIPADSFHIDDIMAKAARKSGTLLLRGGWRYTFRRPDITFFKEQYGKIAEFSWVLCVPGVTECREQGVRFVVEEAEPGAEEISRDNLTVFLDRNRCGDNLLFRSWKAGDQFQPLGSSSPTTVREFLKKQKIAAIDRPGVGVVPGVDGKIVWIPGIRIGHACRVRKASRKLLKISYQTCPSAASNHVFFSRITL